MNKLIAFAVVFAAVASFAADGIAQAKTGRRNMEKKRAASRMKIAEQGGWVQEPYEGNYIRLISTQKKVSLEEIDKIGKAIEKKLSIPVLSALLPSEKDNLDLIEKSFALERTGAVVAIVDGQRGPALQIAPESAWAVVNVDVLNSDNPSSEQLNRRVRQEVWRGLVFALNGTDSQMSPCLMTIVRSLGNLDRNPLIEPSPEPLFKMADGCTARGMKAGRRGTYKRACREGWAPAPTNDIQKAIWDQVHELPTNPLPLVKPAK